MFVRSVWFVRSFVVGLRATHSLLSLSLTLFHTVSQSIIPTPPQWRSDVGAQLRSVLNESKKEGRDECLFVVCCWFVGLFVCVWLAAVSEK